MWRLGVIAALTAFAGGAVAEGLPTMKVLPLALATEAAEAAIAACAAHGYNVSATVVDHDGLLRVQLVGDAVSPSRVEASRRKAYTAAVMKASSGDIEKLFQANPNGEHIVASLDPQVLGLRGGLTIRVGSDVIGGIGVGGAVDSGQDEACAQAGLDRIADRLR